MRSEAIATTAAEPLLSVRNVSVHYDGAIVALEQIDFAVQQGGLIALLGANGAGKTTLMKAIAGMLPFERGEISSGEITFDGTSLTRMHPAAITRRGVALVQDGRQCFRDMTVGENLDAAALLKPSQKKQTLEMVFHFFPILQEFRARQAGFLSGGQLQMLVIGMALMVQPRILLLDEPSLGLSPVMVQSVFDVIEKVHRELGTSVVVAEQTVPRLLKIATDAYVLARGSVVLHDRPDRITEDQMQRVYLS